MTKNLKWRLGKLPTPMELIALIDAKIITEDEAKDILFSDEVRDTKSFETEIKFLRELVEKLAKPQRIVETIREVNKHYCDNRWYQPYYAWSSTPSSYQLHTGTIGTITTGTITTANSATLSGSGAGTTNSFNMRTGGSVVNNQLMSTNPANDNQIKFSNIKTF